jgi:hypothetical protein
MTNEEDKSKENKNKENKNKENLRSSPFSSFLRCEPIPFVLSITGGTISNSGGVAQLVRARGSYPRCPGFKSLHRHHFSLR